VRLSAPEAVGHGDAVRVSTTGALHVLFRRGANANTLFVTERCNSRCLMCSQPPRDDDDSWRVGELLELLDLIDPGLPVLGITGGEPTLLGEGLNRLFASAAQRLPGTSLHVLTNGRTFADANLVASFDPTIGQAVWGVPLYADVAHRHDHVVQALGAFEETVHGLFNLAERGHRIELRCVLSRLTVGRLPQLADYIARNLPFVEHVAFMGLEPMGFARSNRDILWVDPLDYAVPLLEAMKRLDRAGLRGSIYNVPLCVLAPAARPYAMRSISDWKNAFRSECEVCDLRAKCGGFFKSADAAWVSRGTAPVFMESSP
jgi:His-Xaa-Ser system radical SAM maturase HxsC